MRKLLILLIFTPLLFSCEEISNSFGTTYIDGNIYAKINVTQKNLLEGESETEYTATIESAGKFEFINGEKFLLLSEGGYNLVKYPQVPVYNKLSEDITITDDFLSGEKIIVSSSYRYGVADNGGKNIFYGVTSLDLSETKELYECGVDVYKVIKDQTFDIKLSGGSISRVDTIYATLSGIAQRWNLTNNYPEGDASTIELPITANGYSSDNYSTVRLLGCDTLQRQYATISIRFKDNLFDDIIETFDITGQMEDFNNDKSKESDIITFNISLPELETDPTTLSIDVTNNDIDSDESVPTSYTAAFGEWSYIIDGASSYTFDDDFTTSSYQTYVYNTASDISISNSLSTDGKIIVSTSTTNGMVDNNPSTIYYGTKNITITTETANSTEIEVARIMKMLYIDFDITGDAANRVESVSATLSGVSQSWDIVSNSPYGSSANVNLNCGDISNNSLQSWAKLIGINSSDSKTLTVEVTYKDGKPSSDTKTFDLSSDLANFNLNKTTPFAKSITLETPSKVNSDGSINDWGEEFGDDLEAK